MDCDPDSLLHCAHVEAWKAACFLGRVVGVERSLLSRADDPTAKALAVHFAEMRMRERERCSLPNASAADPLAAALREQASAWRSLPQAEAPKLPHPSADPLIRSLHNDWLARQRRQQFTLVSNPNAPKGPAR